MTTLTTDENGKAWTEKIKAAGWEWYGLPLGTYTLEQIKAAKGYALSGENQAARTFEIRYAGQEVPIRYQSELYEIPRQRAQIQIEKKDAETKEKLTGAKFGLYAAEDILAADQKSILVKEDTRLAIAETKEAENGIMDAAFDLDLPMAHYMSERKAPDGYYRSDTERIFDFEPYKDQDHIFIIRMKSEIENAAVKVRLFLRDDLTKKELAGAKLQILDEDGKILHAVSTENTEGKGCLILGLNPEKTYRIVEVLPRKGYKKEILIPDSMKDILKQEQKQEVTFSVSQQYTEETMEQMPEEVVFNLENAFITGKVKILKTGEILNEVSRKLGIVQGLWNQIKPGLVIKQEA